MSSHTIFTACQKLEEALELFNIEILQELSHNGEEWVHADTLVSSLDLLRIQRAAARMERLHDVAASDLGLWC